MASIKPLSEQYPHEHCGAPGVGHMGHPWMRKADPRNARSGYVKRWCNGGGSA